MADPAPQYRKLSGWKVIWWEVRFTPPRQIFPVRVHRLWAAADHLLVVSAALGIERYRRFYFREIEAVIQRRNARRLAWNAVYGVGLALSAGVAAMLYWMSGRPGTTMARPVLEGFAFALGVCAALALIALLWNTLAGPTCTLFIQTRAGLSPLRMFRRTRSADRARAQILPLIAAAQTAATEPAREAPAPVAQNAAAEPTPSP